MFVVVIKNFNTFNKFHDYFVTYNIGYYEHYRDGVYRRKRNTKGIADAEYLEWDHLHNDVEAYSKSRIHIGSIDPEKLTLYKGPVYGRGFPLS